MIRRTPERRPVPVGSVQLGERRPAAARPTLASSPARVPGGIRTRDPAIAARPAARAPSAVAPVLNREWADHLTAPTRASRDRLVIRHAPLVRIVAHRLLAVLPGHVEHADLTQAGTFGLINAIERFAPDRCPRFESFATRRIRGAMLDELRVQDWVPRAVRSRVREVERAQERLEGRLRRAATGPELAEEVGLSLRQVHDLLRRAQILSIDALVETGGLLGDLFADDALDPVSIVAGRDALRRLDDAVAGLGERDRQVIRLYYLENRTLADIGRLLGVTESRVCQLHSRLVGRLRGRLAPAHA